MQRKNPFSPASGMLELNPSSFPRLYQSAASSQQAAAEQENDAAAANRGNGGDAVAADGEIGTVTKPRRSRRNKLPPVKLEYEEDDTVVKQEVADSTVKDEEKEAAEPAMKYEDMAPMKVEATMDNDMPKLEPSATTAATHQHDHPPPADLQDSEYPPPSRAGPPHWQDVYAGIVHMRADNNAPVDGSGCERQAYSVDPKDVRFQKLVGLMLSAQTKDAVTDEAVKRLDHHWKEQGGLTVANILTADEATIDSLICKVGFHNRKANFILRTARILHASYDDDIPRTIPLLCSLPGVGPKMAYLAMQCAWKDNVGIGVDVHVHRIANRLGWVSSVEAEQTREQMEEWLPQHLWRVINKLLVGFGQQICLPTTPRCLQCTVNTWCPVGRVNVKRIARGLTPVKESKDEAREAAMKRAKKGGKKWTPVKYAKHDESQLSAATAWDTAAASGADKQTNEGVPEEVKVREAEEQAERNAEIVAEEGNAQDELTEENAAAAIEARADHMGSAEVGTEQSGWQQKQKSVRSEKRKKAEVDEQKQGAPASVSTRTRTRGKRLQL